ncbi:MAG: phytoene/squalene synthase family protein [Rubricoccaceae bacterium]
MVASLLQHRGAAPEPPANSSPREEDRYLRTAFRYHSRTFSLATRLLPKPVRLPVATLYLYCRTVDELADSRALVVGTEQALAEADQLERNLDAALAGQPVDGPNSLLWRRLAAVHAEFGLRPGPLHELLDGARWDLHETPVETWDDLLAYCQLVAGSVGAMMLPFLARDRADFDALDTPARALGNAMQLTNIARDVGEDWRELSRTYLPDSALRNNELTPEALFSDDPDVRARYAKVMEDLMGRAEALYNEAEAGIQSLRPAAQTGIRAAARMYRAILNGVRANGYDNLTQRAVVPLRRKIGAALANDYRRRRDGLAAGNPRIASAMSTRTDP